MKTKHLPLLTAAATVLVIASCKKDNDELPPDALTEKIQWNWQIDSIVITENLTGEDRVVKYDGTSADYMDFQKNGKLHTSFRGKTVVSDYTILGPEKKITIDGDNNIIREITDNTFVLYDKDNIATLGTTITTYHLKR